MKAKDAMTLTTSRGSPPAVMTGVVSIPDGF
jgi:hypothetical protein